MDMEWSKSGMSSTELERRQKEYIEAAMNMAKRSAYNKEPNINMAAAEENVPEKSVQISEAAIHTPEEDVQPIAEEIIQSPEVETVELPVDEAVQSPAAENDNSEEINNSEMSEEKEQEPEKKAFGVFDMKQLSEAVRKGEMDGERLKAATEILDEMTEKTLEMERLAATSEHKQEKKSGEPQGLNRYVENHNASCPRCAQANRNGRR